MNNIERSDTPIKALIEMLENEDWRVREVATIALSDYEEDTK